MQMLLERRAVQCALVLLIVAVALLVPRSQSAAADSFSLEQIKSYPFPNELTASATGERIAWAFNERGLRNAWGAAGPGFQTRRATESRGPSTSVACVTSGLPKARILKRDD